MCRWLGSVALLLLWSFCVRSEILLLKVDGAISPGVARYLNQQLQQAQQQPEPPELVVIGLNTPGGFVTSLRQINQDILSSQIPIAIYVSPSGARAMSAGTYMLYAAHIAAMAPATTLGAATPVSFSVIPQQAEKSKQAEMQQQTMQRKIRNDAIAYLRSLAKLRGRNHQWAEQAITESATLSSEEAHELGVIEHVSPTLSSLIDTLEGREVKVGDKAVVLNLRDQRIREVTPDWQHQLLIFISDPNVAYLLLMIGVFGIFIEIYTPGMGLPGILGGICLLMALYTFSALPLTGTGIALLLFGLVLWGQRRCVRDSACLGWGGRWPWWWAPCY
uniref:NfeD family protein n=1 Tax=Dongshaea marina TaxID=2047966 RepID=UPI00131EF3CB|nr:ATP-dependent Clp protease proteolytic subunit [Dongshaea marina]